MREPPDKTTVKQPLSLQKFSDRSAVYLARDTARTSSESKTSTAFFFPAVVIPAIDDAFVMQSNLLDSVPITAEDPGLNPIEQSSLLRLNATWGEISRESGLRSLRKDGERVVKEREEDAISGLVWAY